MQLPMVDKNEIKIFILYLMDRIGYPLTCADVCSIMHQENVVSYFDCADCFAELIDSTHVIAVEKAVKSAISNKEVSVIIAQRPCALLDKSAKPKVKVENCKNCGKCMKLGCPAISKSADGIKIDMAQCVGCEVCVQVCPFDSISKIEVGGSAV